MQYTMQQNQVLPAAKRDQAAKGCREGGKEKEEKSLNTDSLKPPLKAAGQWDTAEAAPVFNLQNNSHGRNVSYW